MATTSTNQERRSGIRAMSLPGGLASLRHRNYRLFFVGQSISVTGTWMQTIAQSWLVLTLTTSPFKLGIVNVLQFAPILFLGLITGVVADRVRKRSLLVATQTVSALLATTLAVLTWTDRVELWHVYLLALGLGITNSFDMPTRQAFVSEMVGPEDLANAIALNSTLFNTGRLLGPMLAGLILAATEPAVCFTLNAVSYLAVIVSLLLMRLPSQRLRRSGRGIEQIREGLRFVRNTPLILNTVIMVGLVSSFAMNFGVWMPLLAKNELNTGPGGFGLLMAALGLGSLMGALVLAFRARGPQPRRMLATAAMLGAGEIALAVLTEYKPVIPLSLALVLLLGFSMTSTMAMANTTVQSNAPENLRGRVMSVYMMVFAGSAPFGALLAGATASAIDTPTSVLLGGAITLAATLIIAVRTGVLQGRHSPVPVLQSAQTRFKD